MLNLIKNVFSGKSRSLENVETEMDRMQSEIAKKQAEKRTLETQISERREQSHEKWGSKHKIRASGRNADVSELVEFDRATHEIEDQSRAISDDIRILERHLKELQSEHLIAKVEKAKTDRISVAREASKEIEKYDSELAKLDNEVKRLSVLREAKSTLRDETNGSLSELLGAHSEAEREAILAGNKPPKQSSEAAKLQSEIADLNRHITVLNNRIGELETEKKSISEQIRQTKLRVLDGNEVELLNEIADHVA